MPRKPARLARRFVVVYLAIALFIFTPYFNWQSSHGSRPRPRFGFLLPTAKAFAWPIFACTELRARQVDAAAAAYFQSVRYVRDGHKPCSAMIAAARKLAEERARTESDEDVRRTLASCFEDVAAIYRKDAAALERIKPPSYLREVHMQITEDTALLADIADRMQQAAEVNEPEQFDELDAEISVVEARITSALRANAQRFGVATE